MKNIIARQLIEFENKISRMFKAKKIRVPIHLSGGNEDALITIFKKIKRSDYVFSTHRNHYHFLLHGGNPNKLISNILNSPLGSMHTIAPKLRFYATAIVCGGPAIATGVAWALKQKESKRKVWCFIGDGATDEGWFYEAWRYAVGQDLPITFIIENNNRSVCTTIEQRWGLSRFHPASNKIIYYEYECKWPHCGVGEYIPL